MESTSCVDAFKGFLSVLKQLPNSFSCLGEFSGKVMWTVKLSIIMGVSG